MALHIPEATIYARFNDSDASGYISSISYFSYMEEARTKFFDSLQKYMEEEMSFIVASAQCKYERCERVKEYLSVTTSITHVGHKSFHLAHTISNTQSSDVIARGKAVIVCFNFQDQQTVLIPASLRAYLKNER
ncbi:acyl-CoA thioesterase [Pradoshia sp.]